MTHSNTARTHPNSYPPLKLGLCTNEADEAKLIGAGFNPVWRIGNQVEGLKPLLGYPRGRYTIIGVAEDLRIIGDSRATIFAKVRGLKAANINFLDIRDNCSDDLVLVERALVAKSSEAGMRNHRTARRRGSLGGKAKAVAAELARAIRIDPEIARRLWSLKEITQKTKLWVLGEGFTLSSCQRHFT